MPAENRVSECPSLNWEEFFVSSNSEDLLPCLLGMYDSIVAAQKLHSDNLLDTSLKSITDAIPDKTNDEIEDNVNKKNGFSYDTDSDYCSSYQPPIQSASADASSEIPWCNFHDISCSMCPNPNNKFIVVRPCSPISITSLSSRSSVCSNGSSLNGSVDADNEESNRQTTGDGNNQPNELFDSLVVDNSQLKNAILVPQTRNSYTTASQYSEDSGIYSNLVRSESLHERSWFYTDGEDFSYTNRVIIEILETELIYVNDLQQIITGYLDEWRNDCNCALSNEQINDLFSNIEEIYNFNRCFLWELEQCGLDPVKIARCFVENNSNFSIYAAYCTYYPRSISILTELMRQEKTAHIFRERQIRLHHTLPLGSYLLKPVQRILKYHLLLQNMVKHTPPDTIGYNDITVALSTMTGIAHHINTMKRRHEHAVRVQEVQSLLTGWQGPDLTTFGELYAEGSFRISGAKAFRHIFLFEHMLLVTKKKEAGILNYKTHILCSNLMLVECIPKEPLCFQIIPFDNPRLQFSIHARSLDEKRYWTLELKRVILENYNVDIPSHARQLVMELGQIQHSENVSIEKISSAKRQHSTPEYLERRKLYKEKKASVKSRLLPLFRRLDTLQNYKMRSKLKKNQFLSEGSIFSDTSANSDESYSNDNELQTLSKTTEDLSQTCDGMTRTLEVLSKTSTNSLSSSNQINNRTSMNISDENEERNSYQQKEKLIEEIIGQLLIASQKFQKAIRDHELSIRSKQNKINSNSLNENKSHATKSNFEDDETDDESLSNRASLSSTSSCMQSILKYTKESANTSQLVIGKDTSILNTSSESLSPSLNVLVPTPPNVWLKQQAEHLATPHKKADSLPRTFQINTEDEWRANRPKTIASDKPTQMNGVKRYENDEIVGNRNFMTSKKKEIVLSVASLNSTTNFHPECKFYRTSVARMTLKKMVRTIGTKLMARRGKNEHSYKIEHDIYKTSSKHLLKMDLDSANDTNKKVPVYRQGSSDLGARIANAKEVSDYADPKVLFPTITPSKKAASLLGIRAFSNLSQSKTDVNKSTDGNEKDINIEESIYSVPALLKIERDNINKSEDSDCSADSFYERQFEEVESEFENAIRETSILNDSMETDEFRDISESFRRYSRVNVNISVHKLIKIPPPVPIKPATLKNSHIRIIRNKTKVLLNARKPSSNYTTEFSVPAHGWVKKVVDKFQSGNESEKF